MSRAEPDHEPQKAAIAEALRGLERTLELFINALTHEAAPVSAADATSPREARRRVCDAYAAIDYAPEQDVNTSPTCLGVIGGSAAVIARANAVNVAKCKLRAACSAIQNQRVRVPVKDGQGGRVVKSLPLVRVILRELSRSDLNLLAAYRKIPILTGRIERVAYVRAHTRAVYRKDRAAIEALLDGLDRAAVDDDRTRLRRRIRTWRWSRSATPTCARTSGSPDSTPATADACRSAPNSRCSIPSVARKTSPRSSTRKRRRGPQPPPDNAPANSRTPPSSTHCPSIATGQTPEDPAGASPQPAIPLQCQTISMTPHRGVEDAPASVCRASDRPAAQPTDPQSGQTSAKHEATA
jgi:hypothetical protein